jgi:FKBP-type peptidyl-prolyl cis-trans isomerase
MEKRDNMNVVLAVVICLILLGVLVFISLNNKNNMPSNNIAAQTGPSAQAGDTVSMNYTGRLQNGTVFDSNVDPKFNHVQPFVFTLGAGQVIPGWDKGIVGMKVGEKKTLTIPPEDGYGAVGRPPIIPPNSTLIFDVELLSIKK